MALASKDPETEQWIQAYRARRAALPATGLINGLPPEELPPAVAPPGSGPTITSRETADGTEVIRNTPYGVVKTVWPDGVPSTPQAVPDRASVAIEQIGAERAAAQEDERNVRRDRYNAFLVQQGIDPDTIGGSRLTGGSRDRTLNSPTLAQQQLAVNQGNAVNAAEGRARIAARRALLRGDGGLWADTMNSIQENNRQIPGGGRSSEENRNYWMERILGALPYRRDFWGMSSNGFGGGM